MSDIAADLPDGDEEVEGNFPFLCTKPGLACKVVEMRDEALEEILDALAFALRVYEDRILGDVVDVHVLDVWDDYLCRIHDC